MKNFSFPRLWNVMKYIFRIDRKWYLGWMLSAPVLLLAGMAFLAMLGLLFEENFVTAQPVGIMSIGLLTTIPGVLICCTFHPMYNKTRRTAFLSLPANMSEKFCAMVLVNGIVMTVMIGVVLIINQIVAWPEPLFAELMDSVDVTSSWDNDPVTLMFSCMASYYLLFVPSLFFLINARVYRFNIVLSAVVFAIMNTVLMVIQFIAMATIDDGQEARVWLIVGLSVILLLSVGSWVLAYICFKRSQIRDFFNR